MSVAFENLIQHLDENDLKYEVIRDRQSIFAHVASKVASYRLVAKVSEDTDVFQVFGYSPVVIPSGACPAIAEAITRANYGLRIGKFEMDLRDGELRFQTSQILTEDELNGVVIKRMIGVTLAMLDRYLPAFLSTIYGNESPKDAVDHVEADMGGGNEPPTPTAGDD